MDIKTTKVSSKGQVVIPQDIREIIGLNPGDTLMVYGEKDTIVLKKLAKPDLKKEFRRLFEKVNKRIVESGLSEEDIVRASEEARHGAKGGA